MSVCATCSMFDVAGGNHDPFDCAFSTDDCMKELPS